MASFLKYDNMMNPIEEKEEFIEINLVSALWLKFDAKNRRLFGTPTPDDIRNNYIKVTLR